ncbi:MAG TPA: hypothetical protein VFU73_00180 [Actinocrinis sp.]|nr:hypothetical protein [Actinocrinis sp.]
MGTLPGPEGPEWIDALPDELAGQRRIMRALYDYCADDADARWLAVSCSLARGAADRLSDVDAGIGAAEGQVGAVTEAVAALEGLGDRVDALVMDWRTPPGGQGTEGMRRMFVQCTDDAQLDLVVMPARIRPGRAPDEVVLLDRDGRLSERFTPDADRVDGEQLREWAFLGWVALADCAKYLDRGSLWEARAQLAVARHHIWALWAAAKGARYPVFGLSQVLDRDPDDLPGGIDGTVPDGPGIEALRDATRAAAGVLAAVSAVAVARYPTVLPTSMARFVGERLGVSRDEATAKESKE